MAFLKTANHCSCGQAQTTNTRGLAELPPNKTHWMDAYLAVTLYYFMSYRSHQSSDMKTFLGGYLTCRPVTPPQSSLHWDSCHLPKTLQCVLPEAPPRGWHFLPQSSFPWDSYYPLTISHAGFHHLLTPTSTRTDPTPCFSACTSLDTLGLLFVCLLFLLV